MATGILHIFLRAIRSTLQGKSRGAPSSVQDVGLVAVSVPSASSASLRFLHRFGSSLNTHFHFHVLVLDGVFSEDGKVKVTFHDASRLQPRDRERLQITVQRRVLRYFGRHGLLDEEVTEDMLTWQATGGLTRLRLASQLLLLSLYASSGPASLPLPKCPAISCLPAFELLIRCLSVAPCADGRGA